MTGPQSGTVQQQLGPLLNGVVNYEYGPPTRAMAFSGVGEPISRYQAQAKGGQADGLGYYVAPCAYAQLQVVEQAIRGTDGLVHADLAEYPHSGVSHTVRGGVRFGPTVPEYPRSSSKTSAPTASKGSEAHTPEW